MEISHDMIALLEQLPQPIFLVKDNTVVYANHGARLRDVLEGANALDLVAIGHQEYQQFNSGKLMLTVAVSGILYNTVITRSGEYHVFCLESEYSKPELRAFAVAAQALREPLTSALFSMDRIIPDRSVQDSPALLAQIKAVNRSIYQIHRAVRNMSDAATIGVSSSMEMRDVVGLIAELAEKANTLLEHTQHHIEFQPLNHPVYCQINRENLERAILNLVSNAVKYASGDGTVRISMQLGANKLYISVQGDCAQAKELISSNIFSGFTREPSVNDSHSGIGLGLTIVHAVAASHKGTLLVEQPSDKSLRFTVSLSTTPSNVCRVKSPVLSVDYSGGFDPFLIELADILPPDLYE